MNKPFSGTNKPRPMDASLSSRETPRPMDASLSSGDTKEIFELRSDKRIDERGKLTHRLICKLLSNIDNITHKYVKQTIIISIFITGLAIIAILYNIAFGYASAVIIPATLIAWTLGLRKANNKNK